MQAQGASPRMGQLAGEKPPADCAGVAAGQSESVSVLAGQYAMRWAPTLLMLGVMEACQRFLVAQSAPSLESTALSALQRCSFCEAWVSGNHR